jgi:hypothetical protein
MSKRIVWEKWRDPYEPIQKAIREKLDELEEAEDLDSWKSSGNVATINTSMAVINTPMGMIPLHESNLPGRNFNFWIGHTNFLLTAPLISDLSKVPGIEALNVLTPYRFRVAIAKAFSEYDVKRDITQVAAKTKSDRELRAQLLRKTVQHLPAWVIFEHGGTLDAIYGNNVESVQSQLETRLGAVVVYSSWKQ